MVDKPRVAPWWNIRARLQQRREDRLRDTYTLVLVEIWISQYARTVSGLAESTGCRRSDVALVLRGLAHEGHVREQTEVNGTLAYSPEIV